jgi:hypothetical protein
MTKKTHDGIESKGWLDEAICNFFWHDVVQSDHQPQGVASGALLDGIYDFPADREYLLGPSVHPSAGPSPASRDALLRRITEPGGGGLF